MFICVSDVIVDKEAYQYSLGVLQANGGDSNLTILGNKQGSDIQVVWWSNIGICRGTSNLFTNLELKHPLLLWKQFWQNILFRTQLPWVCLQHLSSCLSNRITMLITEFVAEPIIWIFICQDTQISGLIKPTFVAALIITDLRMQAHCLID